MGGVLFPCVCVCVQFDVCQNTLPLFRMGRGRGLV